MATVIATPGVVELCEQWTTPAEMLQLEPDLTGVASELLEDVARRASLHLYVATGSIWSGSCTDTVRPYRRCACWHAGGVTSCGCAGPAFVRLGGNPLTGVTEVKVDGVVLPATAYEIRNRSELWRMDTGDGITAWPCCQVTSKPATEKGTWQVKHTYGVAPPALWRGHATLLAAQMAMLYTGQECQIPAAAMSVTTRGVTLTRDPTGESPTGLPQIDRAIAMANPQHVQGSALVWSPGRTLAHRSG